MSEKMIYAMAGYNVARRKTRKNFEEKITKMLGKKFATADFYFKNC